MARRRRSKKGLPTKTHMSAEEQRRSELNARAFGGPISGRRYSFTVEHVGKVNCAVFRSTFAAKAYLDLLLQDDDFDWKNDRELHTDYGLTIKGEGLRAIHDYKMKRDEREIFRLNDDYVKQAAYMRDSSPHAGFHPGDSQNNVKRHSRKGMFKIDAVAEELGITPRACRAELRRVKVAKPAHGWAWRTREEVDNIKRLITGKRTVRIDFSTATKK